MKKFLKIVGIVLLAFVLLMAGMGFLMSRGLDAGKDLTIQKVDLSAFDDNSYIGKYDGGRWSNQVEVTVQDHKITGIRVVKDIMFHNQQLTDTLITEVIDKQNVDGIDAISGSTVTTKAYLKSIENALSKK